MKTILVLLAFLALATLAPAQEATDPAFDPPLGHPGEAEGHVRMNGTIGMVIINGKIYQQFGLRPDIPFGKFGVGLDLTFRFDQDGNFKDDEWDEGKDYIDKLYYLRYGQPGDPFYLRVGALDNVTLGYGLIMRRYANTIQYPEIKRIGVYTEGSKSGVGWQAMMNNLKELDQPGLMAGRLYYNTGFKGLTIGATLAHDGNQFAGILDLDKDGVPDRLDIAPGKNDFAVQSYLRNMFRDHPQDLQDLVHRGFLPNVLDSLRSYKGMKESVTEVGADAGIPIYHGHGFSLWGYGQMAKIVDFGWGWSFPGARLTVGPVELSGEYRRYQPEFRGDFFNFSYEIERVQLENDTTFVTKEHTLKGLGSAQGFFADAYVMIGPWGYAYSWYQDMHGTHYERGKSLYGEAGITPPMVPRIQRVSGYYMQPNMKTLFERRGDGTIYGAKLYLALANNVSLVYDHRITYYSGEPHRTVRVETMVTF
jgi:hypothetical protein